MMEKLLIDSLKEMEVDYSTTPILLAVSGGKDSMVMAHLFLKAKIPFEIAHYNFLLREEESIQDEQFIEDFAKMNNLVFHCKKTDTNKYSIENKLGIQEAARDLRYQWFDLVLEERSMSYVATAHHKDDAAETMLFNFIRGGSFSALKGISKQRKNIIRPMLFASQGDIDKFAKENKIQFREDNSNSSTKYSRNRIRHNVIPELKKINPSLVETMSRTAKVYEQGALIINQVIEKELSSIVISKAEKQKMPINHLLVSQYQNLLIWHWVKAFDFSSKQTTEILNLLDSSSGKKVSSPTFEIIRDREFLVLFPKNKNELPTITFNTIDELMSFSSFRSEMISRSDVRFSNDKKIVFFDLNKMSFPASLRVWQKGDHFSPLGMKGKTQKVSDLLIQEKISVLDKKSVLILSFKGEIAWVVGFRVSEKFKVDPVSIDVLRIELL